MVPISLRFDRFSVMFDKVRAQLFSVSQKAVRSCGCTAIVLGHDSDFVLCGIEQAGCDRHGTGEMVSVKKNQLLTPTEPFNPVGG
jgi:hypothetical protein